MLSNTRAVNRFLSSLIYLIPTLPILFSYIIFALTLHIINVEVLIKAKVQKMH